MEKNPITWVEVSESALRHNIAEIKKLLQPETKLCVCVKANAYGHGLVQTSQIFVDAGADWLAVDKLFEAQELRAAGITVPIYIMGYVLKGNLGEVVKNDIRCVVYDMETIQELQKQASSQGKNVNIHLKIEAGTNRQGVRIEDLDPIIEEIKNSSHVSLEGICTHLSDIEDTRKTDFAELQCKKVQEAGKYLRSQGLDIAIQHCANSAATLLLPDYHMDMVRVGVSAYGMWPSDITHESVKESGLDITLQPALTWKTRVGQIRNAKSGETVSYGRTHVLGRDTKIAVLPVGYYDGYDRGLSNKSHVLVHGQPAPILGRVCMNMIMVDVTGIQELKQEEEVVLIGKQSKAAVSIDDFAEWADTINYEITTRINEKIERINI